MKMKRCNQCILPNTYPRISFDREGVCSFCRFYQSHSRELEDWDALSDLFNLRLEAYKEHDRVRCLVAFSGGKDSSFMLWKLSQNKQLDILAYTLDNLFMHDKARENITSICDMLNVEHVFVKPNFSQVHVYNDFARRHGLFCPACWISVLSEGFRLAVNEEIRVFISALSSTQLLCNLLATHDHQALWEYNREAWEHYWLETWQDILQIVRAGIMPTQEMEETFLFPHPELAPELFQLIPDGLFYFAFHSYDEKMIISQIDQHLDWRKPITIHTLEHTDCVAHSLANLLLSETLPYHPLVGELSVLIRTGQMSRKDALAMIDGPEVAQCEGISEVETVLGISENHLTAWAKSAKPTRYIHYW